MLSLLSIVVLIAQTNAQPLPMVTLSPEWKKAAPISGFEMSRYIRKESDGTETIITLERSDSIATAADESTRVQATFQLIAGSVVTRSAMDACGEQGYRITVTGRNTPSNPEANNMEIVEFRKGSTLYSLIYSFLTPAPLPDAEAALMMLCPT